MKTKLTSILCAFCVLCGGFTLTSCESGKAWFSSSSTQEELKHLQDWAYQQAVSFISAWVTEHIGASKAAVAKPNVEDLFVAAKREGAKLEAPHLTYAVIDQQLRAQFKAAQGR